MGELPPPPAGSAPPPPLVTSERARRNALLIVFLVVFIDLFGFGIVFPLLPRYGEQFLDPLLEGGKESRVGGMILGLLMASFSLMQFLFAPVWGRLSDRVGRRPVLLLGLVGSVVFYALFGLASELGKNWEVVGLVLLFVARLGAGAAGATLGTAQAVIADSTPPEGRARGMALLGAAFGIGFTFGPLMGAAAIKFAPEVAGGPGYLAALFSLGALVLGIILLPETWRPDVTTPEKRLFDWRALKAALHMPVVGLLIITFFIGTFAFADFEATLSLLTKDTLEFDEETNFLLFSYVGIVLMFAQGALYQVLSKRFHVKEIAFMITGVVIMLVGLAGLGSTGVMVHWINRPALITQFMVALAMVSVGFAFLISSVQSLLSLHTDASQQGEILSINQSFSALARILGPLVGLSLYRLPPAHVLPYVLSTGLMVPVVLMTLRVRGSRPRGDKPSAPPTPLPGGHP